MQNFWRYYEKERVKKRKKPRHYANVQAWIIHLVERKNLVRRIKERQVRNLPMVAILPKQFNKHPEQVKLSLVGDSQIRMTREGHNVTLVTIPVEYRNQAK